MNIHVVEAGQTLYGISRQYGLTPGLVARYNGLTPPYTLAVGQALAIMTVTGTHTVVSGDSLASIAAMHQTTVMALWQMNPNLAGRTTLYPGEVLVVALDETPSRSIAINGYAYPYVMQTVLRGILPYAGALVPFSYGINEDGTLVELNDQTLIALARDYDAAPWMHLSTITEDGHFSASRAELIFQNPSLARTLEDAVVEQMLARGYQGLDVDFEFIQAEYAQAYVDFVVSMRARVNALGYPLVVALAPKTYAQQPGALYQGHSYPDLAAAADAVLLMTYEWGYTYSPSHGRGSGGLGAAGAGLRRVGNAGK